MQTAEEQELARTLVDALDLEDVNPEEIDPTAPLFGAGDPDSLGLDSIDALEISLVVAQKYNVQLKADDENNKAIFLNLRTLTNHVTSQG